MSRVRLPVRVTAAGLALGLLACRPVFAIGWGELVILFLIIAFLLGPLLLKLARAWDAYQKSQKKK
ncbi:MAG: hypothetical protein C4583_09055 [Anaerolineaceae bacterium]|nr:MAG: hypothetical protein C4583_09055 [Anaerolineaceae bacterium]